MNLLLKVKNNILYITEINDPDPSTEFIPISSIVCLGKIVKQKISTKFTKEPNIFYSFNIVSSNLNLQIPTIHFSDENSIEAKKSIEMLIKTRSEIIEAMVQYHK